MFKHKSKEHHNINLILNQKKYKNLMIFLTIAEENYHKLKKFIKTLNCK